MTIRCGTEASVGPMPSVFLWCTWAMQPQKSYWIVSTIFVHGCVSPLKQQRPTLQPNKMLIAKPYSIWQLTEAHLTHKVHVLKISTIFWLHNSWALHCFRTCCWNWPGSSVFAFPVSHQNYALEQMHLFCQCSNTVVKVACCNWLNTMGKQTHQNLIYCIL